MVGQTRIDVKMADEMGFEGDISNVGKTELLVGATVLDCAMDETPEMF